MRPTAETCQVIARKIPAKRLFTGLAGRAETSEAPPPIKIEESCSRHGQVEPCYVCERNERDRVVRELLQKRWSEVAHEFVVGTPKCVHGHMYSDDYCDVCRLGPVDPTYNPLEHDVTINKAMRKAKTALLQSTNGLARIKVDNPTVFRAEAISEGQRNWEDLRQLVDLEVWIGKKRYRNEWNSALCYTIARHTAGAYLGELIRDKYILVEDVDGNPVLDEFGKQQRIPRFVSFDVRGKDEEGKVNEVSPAEKEIVKARENQPLDDLASVVEGHRPGLEALVRGWHGDLRKVGEAVLAGTFTARGVPGVSKSSASRSYKTVTTAFRTYIAKASIVSKIQASAK